MPAHRAGVAEAEVGVDVAVDVGDRSAPCGRLRRRSGSGRASASSSSSAPRRAGPPRRAHEAPARAGMAVARSGRCSAPSVARSGCGRRCPGCGLVDAHRLLLGLSRLSVARIVLSSNCGTIYHGWEPISELVLRTPDKDDSPTHRIRSRRGRRRPPRDDPRRRPRARRRGCARPTSSQRLGIARHTFRAATQILINEGLLRREPRIAASSSRVLDADDIVDIFRLREALEIEAIRHVMAAGSEIPEGARHRGRATSTRSADDASWRDGRRHRHGFPPGDHRRDRRASGSTAPTPAFSRRSCSAWSSFAPTTTGPSRSRRSTESCSRRSQPATSRRRRGAVPQATSTRPRTNLTSALEAREEVTA